MALTVQQPYTGISPRSYEHPADRAATAALQKIPLLDRFVRLLAEWRYERTVGQELLGDAVRLGPDQLPAVWSSHQWAHRMLDLGEAVPLYVRQAPSINAMAVGIKRPVVLLNSEVVTGLDADEQRTVLAHEAGHILCDHLMYRTALLVLLEFSLPRLPVLGTVPLEAIRLALLEWARATELSSDRAAAIVMRDPMPVCRVLMKSAGGPVPGLSVDGFLRQAEEYHDWDDLFDLRSRFLRSLQRPHPPAARRVTELVAWVRGGAYDRILAGDYVHLGEEPPVSAEFGDAVEHYTELFTEAIESSGVAIQKLGERIGAWIESVRGGDSAPPEPEPPNPARRRAKPKG